MRLVVASLVAGLGSFALLAQNPASNGKEAAAPAGNAQNGKKLFDSDGCYQCHGFAAQGGVGPRLGPRPLSWAAFSRYVRQPTDQMPPYTVKVVSDKDLADIYAYLVSIPAPPAAKGIPILNQ